MTHCADALSTVRNTDAALEEVLSKLSAAKGVNEGEADLALIFSTMHHVDALDRIAQALTDRGLGRVVLGCTCESIVGEGREIEASTGLSVWSARLPGVTLSPFSIEHGDAWPEAAGTEPTNAVILLGEPFQFAPDVWFRRIASEMPGVRVLGGMASGGSAQGQNRLVLNGQVHRTGAVGVALRGDLAIRSIVSQGCRPIGRPLIVTRAENNIIRELGRRPALEVLKEIFESLDADDQERLHSGLHIGRVINEYRESFGRGDFLVRNVMGADPTGGIAISDLPRVGQTVQFQVRDAETADEDLRQMIGKARDEGGVSGALLFTCNGRGSRLFDVPHHDVGVLRELLGPIPVAGFFAMGELGPVGGENFVHGFTASVVLFGQSTGSNT